MRASIAAALILLSATLTSLHAAGDNTLPTRATEEPTVDATLRIAGHLFAAGVGYKWGHGTLDYHGQDLEFCIHGLSIGEVGVASLAAQGVVFNLKSLDDFPGRYFAVSAGAAIARGDATALFKNKRAVMIELESKVTGLRFSIAATGLRIALAGARGCAASAKSDRATDQ